MEGPSAGDFRRLESKVDDIKAQGEEILTRTEQLEAAVTKIDEATTLAGQSLQNISDDQDRLIEELKNQGVSDALITRLQTGADNVALLASAISAVASKVTDPVPEPIPVIDPIPEPEPTV